MNDDVIREFEGRIAKVEASAASAHKRIDDVDKLTESVYTLANETKRMREDLGEIKGRVEVMESKPSKRWDLVTAITATAIITGVIEFLITKVLH